MSNNHILSIVLFLPLAGAALLLFVPKEQKKEPSKKDQKPEKSDAQKKQEQESQPQVSRDQIESFTEHVRCQRNADKPRGRRARSERSSIRRSTAWCAPRKSGPLVPRLPERYRARARGATTKKEGRRAVPRISPDANQDQYGRAW